LTVTGFGKDDKAYAARVKGYNSINKIPHVTLCVAPKAHAKDSNTIIEWSDTLPSEFQSSDFILRGVVSEHFVIQGRTPKPKQENQKVNIAKLIVNNSTKCGKEVGPAIKQVTEWMEKMNLSATEENIPALITYIKGNLTENSHASN